MFLSLFQTCRALKCALRLCWQEAGRDDWVLCQVTSNPYGDERAVALTDKDFKSGSLRVISYARPGKLFTANESLIAETVGELRKSAVNELIGAVIALLQESVSE